MKKMQKRLHARRNECECRENDAETLMNVREFTKYFYRIAWKDDLKMFQM